MTELKTEHHCMAAKNLNSAENRYEVRCRGKDLTKELNSAQNR